MHGELAETICLICHGSVWLREKKQPAPRLEGTSAFQYVKSVHFAFQRSPGTTVEATDAQTWMAQLAERGVERLWLVTGVSSGQLDERLAVAFVGAGSWAIVGSTPRQQELWRGMWSLGDREDPNRRIWQVEHTGAPISDLRIDRPAVADAQAELLAALDDARAFSAENELEFWADWFNDALALAMPDVEPEPRYHPDLAPRDGYSFAARRLLAIATNSWVFGGMGSWNDLGFVDDQRYKSVSERLYGAMMNGFLASVNSPLDGPVQ